MDFPVFISVSAVGLTVVGLFMWYFTGSILSLLVVLCIASLVAFLLHTFGVLDFKTDKSGVDIQFHENGPAPSHEPKKPVRHLETKEVYYVSGNNWNYEEAPAVCSAYGGELASYDQLMDAFSKGAEWCGYGWSAGGMALYPTQQSTWNALQQESQETKRTACGHPGVNGGYFDPKMKFGVNCYGIKRPNKGTTFPAPLPGTDSKTFDDMVNKFKKSMGSIVLSPFNRGTWSAASIVKPVQSDLAYAESEIGTVGKRLYSDI